MLPARATDGDTQVTAVVCLKVGYPAGQKVFQLLIVEACDFFVFEVVSHREAGTHLYPGMLSKMSKTPLGIRKPPPCLGEHNDYVFKEVMGTSDDEIAELEKEQLIGGDEYVVESIF